MSSHREGSEVSDVLAEPLFLVEVLVLAGRDTKTFFVMTVSTISSFSPEAICPGFLSACPLFPSGSGS